MKDALGHGSDGKGAHSEGVQQTPKLQRRHFEAIAAELKARGAGADEVHATADKLSTTNPGFRRDYFVAAATGGIIPKGTVTTVTGKTSVRDAAYRNKGPGSNAAAVGRKAAKFTPVQSENAPFKSRLGKAAGHSYLDPHDPRARK